MTTPRKSSLAVLDVEDVSFREFQNVLNLEPQLVAATEKAAIAAVSAIRSTAAIEVLYSDLKIMPDFNPRLPNPENPEEEEAEIEAIADSIIENGFYADMPLGCIAVKEGGRVQIYVTNGHRRMKAFARAIEKGYEGETVYIVLKPEGTNMDDLNVAFVQSSGSKRLKPLEFAIICKRMSNTGNTDAVIAKRLGFTVDYVEDLKYLSGAPSKIRYMVQCDKVSAALAISAMKSQGDGALATLESAFQRATGAGKIKVTAKFMPADIQRRAVKKQAPLMFSIVQRVRDHSAFKSLPDDLQADVTTLLAAVADSLPDDLLADKELAVGAKTHE